MCFIDKTIVNLEFLFSSPQESLLISTTMCQGLAVISLRSSLKVCDAWSTEATTPLVREIEKTHITNSLQFDDQASFLHCPANMYL